MKPIALLTVFAGTILAGGVPVGKPAEGGMSPERLARIHEAVQRHIDSGNVTGAVTLVARKGRIVHFEAHGVMDLESKKPMAKDTIFRLASMTKPVTATAVMMLVEEGKLRLLDPISKYLPEFKESKVATDDGAVPAKRQITIQDLLTHTSGLMSGGKGSKQAPARWGVGDTLKDYIPKLAAVPLDFQPGSDWAYSGLAGPDILGRIVEIVSGQSYDQFLKTRLFDPLGMKDTFFYPPEDRGPRVVTLYRRGTNGLEKAPNQDPLPGKTYFSGAGGLMSTAEDYAQFAQMLLNGGQLNGKRFLGPRTVQLMSSNHVGEMFNGKLGRPARGMGFGYQVAVIQDSVAAGLRVTNGSFGWDGAFGTQTWIDPKEQMVTIIMMQTQTGQLQRDFENAVMQAIVE